MSEFFAFDVFLSHSSKDKAVVREVAERLRADGVRVWLDDWEIRAGDSIPAKIEEGLERSRVLVLCMSEGAFGSDWAQLEAGTFRFRDPLNKERRFIPLKLDDARPRGSLGQFLHVDWRAGVRGQEYGTLLEACRRAEAAIAPEREAARERLVEKVLSLGHTDAVRSVAFSPDGRRALSGSVDKTVRLWDVDTARALAVLEGHTDAVMSVAFGPDGRRALSGSYDRTVRLWDLEAGQTLAVLEGHTDSVFSVAFCPDGKRALSASADRTLRLWDVNPARALAVLEGHTDSVNSVACSPDGRQAVSGADDRRVRLWDVDSGRPLAVLEGHSDSVFSVAFGPDGKRVLSGSGDKTLRLWDIEAARLPAVLKSHSDRVSSVAFSQDGHRGLSGSADGTVRLWDVDAACPLGRLEGSPQ